MARVVVEVDRLWDAVHTMVENNIDRNHDALIENITAAAEHARDELSNPAGHNQGGGSWRGYTSLSGGHRRGKHPTPIGFYSTGWHVYGRRTKMAKFERVVANKHVPHLTHLLEFGHASGNGRVMGDYAIREAYRNAAPLVRGGI